MYPLACDNGLGAIDPEKSPEFPRIIKKFGEGIGSGSVTLLGTAVDPGGRSMVYNGEVGGVAPDAESLPREL